MDLFTGGIMKGENDMGNKIVITETERLILRRYIKEDVQDMNHINQ